MASEVYISYADADEAAASAMRSFLEDNGINCIPTPEGGLPASEDVIASCSVFVVIYGETSDSSDRILYEIREAISQRKTVIPFMTIPDRPSGVMDYYLSTLHWLYAYGVPQEAAFSQLLGRIKAVLGIPAQQMISASEDVSAPYNIAQSDIFVVPEGSISPGPDRSSETEVPASGHERDAKPKKKGIVKKILRIIWCSAVALLLFAIAFSLIPETFMRQSLRNGDTIELLNIFIVLIIVGAYHVMRVFGIKLTKHPGLLCFAVISVIGTIGGRLKTHYGSLQPKVAFPYDTDPVICMNAANESFAAVSPDGYVYYCDSPDGKSSVYRSPVDDFLNGAPGEIVLKNTSADNLGFLPDGRLLYREISSGRNRMMTLDPDTGRKKKLKSKDTSHYVITDEAIFYQECGKRHRGIGVILPSRKYDGRAVTSGLISSPFQYGNSLYYVVNSSFVTKTPGGGAAMRRDIHGRFIVHNDLFYFAGEDGGLFSGPLEDSAQAEKLAENSPADMIVYEGTLYYLDADDGTLWSISLDGGRSSRINDSSYASMCLIGNCLCLQDTYGRITRMLLENTV